MSRYEEIFHEIAKIIADDFGMTTEEMFANSKLKRKVEARQIFHYVIHKHFTTSLSVIGEFSIKMGRNKPHHHASVLYGYNLIRDRMQVDKRFERQVSFLENFILDKIKGHQPSIEKQDKEVKGVAQNIFITENKSFIKKIELLIKEILNGNREEDIDYLTQLQKEKNNGRLHKTSPSNTVLGKISGHKHEGSFYTHSS